MEGVGVVVGVVDGVGLGVTGVLVGMGSGVPVGPTRVTGAVALAVGVLTIGKGVVVGCDVQVGGEVRISPAVSSSCGPVTNSTTAKVGTRVANSTSAGWQPPRMINR